MPYKRKCIAPHLDEEQRYVLEEAGRLLVAMDEEKKTGQWSAPYKKQAMELLWKCHLQYITPPFDLVILVGILFGKRYDWPPGKFIVVKAIAKKYDPVLPGEPLPRGIKSFAHKIIEENGGLLETPRSLDEASGNIDHDYRKDIKPWLSDPVFMARWAHERRVALNRARNFDQRKQEELLAIIEKWLSLAQ